MPELPEVETVRKDLQRLLRGERVVRVLVSKDKMVRGNTRSFQNKLKGQTVKSIKRRGKLLIFDWVESDWFLLVHLKMTGQLICQSKQKLVGGGHGEPRVRRDELPNKYSHVIITWGSGARLFFNDMRQFGFMQLVDKKQLAQVEERYGVEPLSDAFTVEKLGEILKGRRTAVKNVLLDQRGVAGLGNIYVDESCWWAGVRPTKLSGRVTKQEAAGLRRAIRQVLKKAISRRGTTFGSFRDGLGGKGKFVELLKVYGRAGKPCDHCRTILKKVKVGGRGTVYCPRCQK